MGKSEWKGGSVGNERYAHRGDKGWEQPRDADRDPAPYDPDMDRYAIGSNDPNYPTSK